MSDSKTQYNYINFQKKKHVVLLIHRLKELIHISTPNYMWHWSNLMTKTMISLRQLEISTNSKD